MALYDVLAIHAAFFLAIWARWDFRFTEIPADYMLGYNRTITVYALLCIPIFWFNRMYKGIWRYASYTELVRALTGSIGASLLYALVATHVLPVTGVLPRRMPYSYHLWGAVMQTILLVIVRFAYRFIILQRSVSKKASHGADRVMIIGAGSAGESLLKDISTSQELNDQVVCFIDDNSNKWNRYVGSVPIVGGREDILASVKKYGVQKIYLAIPAAPAEAKRDIISICQETDCELKQLPGIYQLVSGQVTVSQMRDVSVEDLLGRDPIKADMEEVYSFINGKTVLVTGGGGSIGSELCRQIAAHSPRQLIIFDVYENNAYSIQLELRKKYPELNLVTLIGSVRDSRRIFQVFDRYRPQIVYHAAAHKHVPLMEDSPCESIKNNAVGTYKTAYAAMVHGCERFVLISTDKAVNPTNIMGASKRLCEMIIQAFDAMIKADKVNEIPQLFTHVGKGKGDQAGKGLDLHDVKTEFVAVRFGNVLGSNGSVIPIFKKQIENGGPVTVTHPDIIRYFMTIPEAVSLVMLAGTYAKGGEIFVLDMGSPVKIDTLARNLIKLSGFKPDVDIKIEYTGLRPGEKLYEEKLMAEEGLKKTDNALIHIGCPIPFDERQFLGQLSQLMDTAYDNKEGRIRELVAGIVPTYHPAGVKPASIKDAAYERLVHEADQ
ncbi:MAG: polysaccharide biosynthesis protein [Clostridia bacterium]|nr:polysaccharide biosynthesis protein [Clostridia bacterium]